MLSRRALTKNGYVNFPINNSSYVNSSEGGMFVRLVVEFPEKDVPMVCAGGSNYIVYDESYLGDDNRSKPVEKEELELIQKDWDDYESYHFPNLHNSDLKGFKKYISRPYLCALTIGSTGWSGWSEEKKDYFICTYEDLTEEGKSLYNNLKNLYPNCPIRIQTWLDT